MGTHAQTSPCIFGATHVLHEPPFFSLLGLGEGLGRGQRCFLVCQVLSPFLQRSLGCSRGGTVACGARISSGPRRAC